MSQMIEAISFCHENEFYFEIGSLNEFNIYLSETLDHCFIDTGFFDDEEIELPRYYTENEFGEEKQTKSEKDDIFAIGIVFFRLITLLSIEEIEGLFEKETKSRSRRSSVKKRRNSISGLIDSVLSNFEANEKPLKYLANFRFQMFKEEKGYNEDLLILILKMLDPVELNRPTAETFLESLQLIQKKSLNRYVFSKENSLTKITEGWSFEQKAIMSDVLYRQFLKDFLRIEFCVETLLFFEDISKFKELKGTERIEKANEIIHSYLSTRKSTLQVNVNAKQIKNISSNIKIQLESNGSIDDSIFDDSLGHVINTMMCDNYPRFRNSNLFQKLEIIGNNSKTPKLLQRRRKSSIKQK